MIAYDFYHISEDDFERLIVDICKSLLGIGMHSFTKGRDGGKDGYFDGTATCYPSAAKPWHGKFIIQAKHTTLVSASCSDNDFFINKTSVLNKEIDRLKQMRDKYGQAFDNYLLFTNRALTGTAHNEIRKHLQVSLGIQNADVIGKEDLMRLVEANPELARRYHKLVRYILPDQFYEQDIRDVIVLFSNNTNWVDISPLKDTNSFDYTEKEKKNALNDVDDSYFTEIKCHSLKFFHSIDQFLRAPRNYEYRKKYLNTTSDLRGYIQKHSTDYKFIEILETIIDSISGVDSNSNIFQERALVRVFVHYMYWNCDIGCKK